MVVQIDELKAQIADFKTRIVEAEKSGDKVAVNHLRGQITYTKAKLIGLAKKLARATSKTSLTP